VLATHELVVGGTPLYGLVVTPATVVSGAMPLRTVQFAVRRFLDRSKNSQSIRALTAVADPLVTSKD
jgi:hypothetical protein